ncbi:MAG: hypothetical protein ACXWFZ_03360, partial [Nitrososphaeraceae archaeon]
IVNRIIFIFNGIYFYFLSLNNLLNSSTSFICLILNSSSLSELFSFNVDVIMGIPADLVKGDYLFGRTIGIVDDENEKPLWIISGHWKTNLSNQTQDTANNNTTVLNADIEMIKTDGTSKHTHTMTNFVLADASNQNNNSTIFNGTATISMPQGPVTEVPISIQIMNNSLGIINIDPNKIDNHFGNDPLYGIPLEEREHYKKKS